MTAKSVKEFYSKIANTPEGLIKCFLFQMHKPVSISKIWETYMRNHELRNSNICRSETHMIRYGIEPLIKRGIVIRGRAFDANKYKHGGIMLKRRDLVNMRKMVEKYPELIPFKLKIEDVKIIVERRSEIIFDDIKILEFDDLSFICLLNFI